MTQEGEHEVGSKNGSVVARDQSADASQADVLEHLKWDLSRLERASRVASIGHSHATENWTRINYLLGIPTTVLAGVAGVSALSAQEVLAGAIAVCVAALSAVQTFLNPSQNSRLHKEAADSYQALSDEARNCWKFEAKEGQGPKLKGHYYKLLEKRDELNKRVPSLSGRTVARAKRDFEVEEKEEG